MNKVWIFGWFKRKTMKARHFVVKKITPELYSRLENVQRVDNFFSKYPRPMIQFIKNRNNKSLIGAEVGVGQGHNAESILKILNIEQLYLIDPYSQTPVDISKKIQAREGLSKFKDKINFIYEPSPEAVNLIPDELDFVYIDANHSYASVKKDVEAWFPKIKINGILGGHDFIWLKGVHKAVTEFVNEKNLKLYHDMADWWVKKGEWQNMKQKTIDVLMWIYIILGLASVPFLAHLILV